MLTKKVLIWGVVLIVLVIVAIFLPSKNKQLSAECNDGWDGEPKAKNIARKMPAKSYWFSGGIISNKKLTARDKSIKDTTTKVISIKDTSIIYTQNTILFWRPHLVKDMNLNLWVKKKGWQHFHKCVDNMACFEELKAPEYEKKGIRFVYLKRRYDKILVKNSRQKKFEIDLLPYQFEPGLILLHKNKSPEFYSIFRHGCEVAALADALK
ncbi:MAG: hypothetical protein MUC87_06185 [Bacteroidia bacterium]|jgi:hypothetical protein|nr:hypothetical protein [Bacteroidia bacterium]